MDELRLADPLLGLSAIGDLGRGLEPGHAARTCFIGCRLGRALEVDEEILREVFFAALLQHIGCIAHAHDTTALDRGRTLEVLAAADRTDFAKPADVVSIFLTELTQGGDLLTRLRLLLPAARMGKVVSRTSCEVAEMTARRIGLPGGVQAAVHNISEWYNGKGSFKRKGDEIPIAARIVLAAFTVSIFDQLGGPDAAIECARSRAGKSLDPAVSNAFVHTGRAILSELASIDLMKSLPAEEPEPNVCVGRDSLDEIAIAFGEIVDLKTPYTNGSAARAFDLAGRAAALVGLEPKVVAETRRAAALRDIGHASLPNAILEKPGPLTELERDQVQLHPYQTERVLGRSPVFAEEMRLAGAHHERVDGSGYHRALRGPAIPLAARTIAAVDVFVALTQPRPHRPALNDEEACRRLVDDRGLDRDAVDAVVAAVRDRGRPARRRSASGLTDRQIEVLRLVAAGLNNRQIAEQLVVSPRTAERHVQDIYLKIGVSSRAAAALFAAQNELL